MSSDQVAEKARQTLKSMKELLEKAEESTHKALDKAAPAVQKSVDSSLEAAAKGFNSTMKSFEGATGREQLDLLRTYKKFLDGQVQFVESRIRSLESKGRPKTQ